MDARIKLVQGDITKLEVDAVVNAANSALAGGAGVDGAIHRAGGPKIMEECQKIGHCAPGDAVVTAGGNLPAKFVIHTVGPVWRGGDSREDQLLMNAYENSLKRAVENNVSSIAFPNISTGIYGFPRLEAARIAIAAVGGFLAKDKSIKEVIFCCFEDGNYELYKQLMS
jgi:O-acetyl-ADP-ribose deacetylase (regulator of RNase III)